MDAWGAAVAATRVTPTIAWAAPAQGTVSHYVARLYEPASSLSFATFQTTATGFVVPPGLLQGGKSYVVSVTAVGATSSAPIVSSQFSTP